MALAQIADHVAQAQARLLQQYRDKPLISAFVGIFAARLQLVENALWAILTQRSLTTATGQTLDNVGKLVGLARAGLPDPVYRAFLLGQVLINRSSGTAPDLDGVMLAMADLGSSVAVLDSGPASVVVRVFGVAQSQPAALGIAVQAAKAGGVRAILEYLGTTQANAFTWDGTAAQAWDLGAFAAAI